MPKLISDRPDLIRQVRAEPQAVRSETAYRRKSTKQTSSPRTWDGVSGEAGRWRWVGYESLDVLAPVFPCRCSTRSYRGGWCDWA